MKIVSSTGPARNPCAGAGGFTLIEVAFAAAIAALVLAGMFQGYNLASRRAQFSACSLAANSAAMRQMETVLSANWNPTAGTSNLLTMSGTVVRSLDLPSAQNNMVNCTNITTVTQVSSSPAYAMVQVDCIWTFPSYGGVYTNTVAVLKSPY
jgi:type II secretory pathway pseudopilin PulG